MLILSPQAKRTMEDHLRSTYPYEGCGLLLGRFEGERTVGRMAVPCKNLNEARAHDRYVLDPKDYASADREAGRRGLEIVGIFHSHPDHPSRPSDFDRARALEIEGFPYSYLLVSVEGGTRTETRSWRLDPADRLFHEEPLLLQGEEEAGPIPSPA